MIFPNFVSFKEYNQPEAENFIKKNITMRLNQSKNATNLLVTFAHLIISLDANRNSIVESIQSPNIGQNRKF